MQITIPRWAQVVLAPLALIVGFFLIGEVSHALFVFLMATLLALLLNPIVQSLRKAYVPRVIGVPLVYLTFVALLVILLVLGVPPLMDQAQELLSRAPELVDVVEGWVADIQEYLIARGLEVDLQATLDRTVLWFQNSSVGAAGTTIFSYTVNVVGALATFFLVVIISFYMLLDGDRIHRYLRRVLPGDDETAESYLEGMQLSFTRYVKGQLLLATSVGLAAGFGIWALGWDVVGIWPEGSRYALLFGFWAGITEVIPFVGPFLGAAPPVLLALFNSPSTALWVALVYFVVQQVENHILVPNIIGSSVGVHPLVVIFALLAGAQVGGIVGMLAVLPVLAMLKHTLDFYQLRLSRASWVGEDGIALTAQPGGSAGRAEGRLIPPAEVEVVLPAGEPPAAAEDEPGHASETEPDHREASAPGQEGPREGEAEGAPSPVGRRAG